jgi:hypothetical protein
MTTLSISSNMFNLRRDLVRTKNTIVVKQSPLIMMISVLQITINLISSLKKTSSK